LPDIPLPSGWAKNVKSAIMHVISLAQYAIAASRGWAANSINARVRLAADNDHRTLSYSHKGHMDQFFPPAEF
jgi:hypothetical protein